MRHVEIQPLAATASRPHPRMLWLQSILPLRNVFFFIWNCLHGEYFCDIFGLLISILITLLPAHVNLIDLGLMIRLLAPHGRDLVFLWLGHHYKLLLRINTLLTHIISLKPLGNVWLGPGRQIILHTLENSGYMEARRVWVRFHLTPFILGRWGRTELTTTFKSGFEVVLLHLYGPSNGILIRRSERLRLAHIQVNLRAIRRLQLASIHHQIRKSWGGFHGSLLESSGVIQLTLRHLTNRRPKFRSICHSVLTFIQNALQFINFVH